MDRGIERHKSPDRPPGARLGGFFFGLRLTAQLCSAIVRRGGLGWCWLTGWLTPACLPRRARRMVRARPPCYVYAAVTTLLRVQHGRQRQGLTRSEEPGAGLCIVLV